MTFLRTLTAGLFVASAAVVGCATPTSESPTGEHQLGLDVTRVSDDVVEGKFSTAYGDVTFRSVKQGDVVHVEFQRDGRLLTSDVNWSKLTNDLAMPEGTSLTKEDRFVLKGLSSVLEEEIDRKSTVGDNLVRQSILWGAHPEGPLVVKHIQADPKRSWTTLCSAGACSSGYRNFYHDAASHGLQGEYLKFGKQETANPCRSRCGAGCTSIGTSAWTADCGNHDRCEQLHGSSDCMDEFSSASDDYTFAGNCSC